MPSVLVVEDEAIVQMNLQFELQARRGFRIVQAYDTSEALTAAANESFDVACVDVMLNGDADGLELARTLRDRWGIPVVFVSGNTDEKTTSEASAVGAAAFLAKPIDFDELARTLNSLVA